MPATCCTYMAALRAICDSNWSDCDASSATYNGPGWGTLLDALGSCAPSDGPSRKLPHAAVPTTRIVATANVRIGVMSACPLMGRMGHFTMLMDNTNERFCGMLK